MTEDYAKDRRTARRIEARRYLESVRRSSKCVDCGESNPIVLQFHHRDGKDKYAINMYCRSGVNHLKKELEKCDVLCANCHLIRHHDEQSGFNAQRIIDHKEIT
jgi:hypothetical protein